VAARDSSKTLSVEPVAVEAAPERTSQRKRPEPGRYSLLVDRQLKGSYKTAEEAGVAGLAIKTGHPIVQVTVYDTVDLIGQAIELAKA
jgi:hypothetical protein